MDKYYNHENDYYNPAEDAGENANWKAIQKAFSEIETGGAGTGDILIVKGKFAITGFDPVITAAITDLTDITVEDFTDALNGNKIILLVMAGAYSDQPFICYTMLASVAISEYRIITGRAETDTTVVTVSLLDDGNGFTGTISLKQYES